MSDKARNKGRMAIYSMAGIYLLFMAYNLVKELPYTSGNQKILSIVFIIFFGIVGGGMVVLSLIQGYKLSKPQQRSLQGASRGRGTRGSHGRRVRENNGGFSKRDRGR